MPFGDGGNIKLEVQQNQEPLKQTEVERKSVSGSQWQR